MFDRKAYMKKYRAKYQKEHAEYFVKYRKRNREKIRRRMKFYCARPEVQAHKSDYNRKYYQKNKKVIDARSRKRYQEIEKPNKAAFYKEFKQFYPKWQVERIEKYGLCGTGLAREK